MQGKNHGVQTGDGVLAVGIEPEEAHAASGPAWLRDMRDGRGREGFYLSVPGYAAQYSPRDPSTLVVTFDNLSSARSSDHLTRDTWGYDFVKKRGWSHLGVFAYEATWFREPALFQMLERIAADGIFSRYASVTMMGTSMGAYAATAFASLAPGCTVLAYSPQSTLKKDLVPWESRFSSGRKADWSGSYADATQETAACEKVWLVYDPAMEPDRMHVERYRGANIHPLRLRHGDHKTALMLRRAGVLSTIGTAVVERTLTAQMFTKHVRITRTLPWYLNELGERIAATGRQDHMNRFVRTLRNMNKPAVAKNMAKKFGMAPTERAEPKNRREA